MARPTPTSQSLYAPDHRGQSPLRKILTALLPPNSRPSRNRFGRDRRAQLLVCQKQAAQDRLLSRRPVPASLSLIRCVRGWAARGKNRRLASSRSSLGQHLLSLYLRPRNHRRPRTIRATAYQETKGTPHPYVSGTCLLLSSGRVRLLMYHQSHRDWTPTRRAFRHQLPVRSALQTRAVLVWEAAQSPEQTRPLQVRCLGSQ